MIVYDNEASGFLCMNFDGSFRMVKLTLLSSESFRLTVHNGQEIEMSYEKSFVKRRKRWTMGFYVKKMRMVA